MAVAMIVPLALTLSACASRPGSSVLTPVAGVEGAKQVTIFVASTRAAEPGTPTILTDTITTTTNYIRYVVSIPPTHRPTEIQWPTDVPDPARHFSVISSEPLDEKRFLTEVGASAARGEALGRDVGIFIHGFNNNFQESLFRAAQLTVDVNLARSAVLFTWPSKATITGYLADKDAVTFSRDALARLVQGVAGERRIRGVKLYAHSMGSWLTMESIRQIRIAKDDRTLAKLLDITLAAPDIDAEVFLQQLLIIGRLRSPVTVLVSKDDQALSLSRFIAGGQLRAGAADIEDPRVLTEARNANLRVIDITDLATQAGSGHDGFAAFASIYGRLRQNRDGRVAPELGPGVYTLVVSDRLETLGARLVAKIADPAPSEP
ncbi:MAG TPA: alpha/beta hydrolase [Bosea sp. (in: a-proteobacteria)]|jgi:esterase/lipase superfamily enzyme|nr:alpha/beta hydrolase [Bosea sp. (in: a-proteobacteria)]